MKCILCFGDSITFGEEENGGWCELLKIFFEGKDEDNAVYNLGINGQTSTELLERFEIESNARIKFTNPDDKYTTIVAIGTNDAKYNGRISKDTPRTTTKQFEKNIFELIKKAKFFKQKITFLGLPPVDEMRANNRGKLSSFTNRRINELNNIIKECCKKESIPFLDLNKTMIAQNYKNMLADGLHPNSKGYAFMFKEIKTFLEENELFP